MPRHATHGAQPVTFAADALASGTVQREDHVRSHLDLEVEVGGICDLGLEHGPVLAHEVTIDAAEAVPTL